jgi:hypothetical protein
MWWRWQWGGSTPPPPGSPPAPPTAAELADASRFTAQATFGLPYAEIDALAQEGRDAGEFVAYEDDIEYLILFRRLAWWHRTVTARDVLWQRVAFALSEAFVVSDNVDALIIRNPEAGEAGSAVTEPVESAIGTGAAHTREAKAEETVKQPNRRTRILEGEGPCGRGARIPAPRPRGERQGGELATDVPPVRRTTAGRFPSGSCRFLAACVS